MGMGGGCRSAILAFHRHDGGRGEEEAEMNL